MSSEETTTTTTTTTTEEVETQTTPTVVKIKAEDCPVEVVTVFTNRAEVVRNVKTTFDAPGLYDVTVEGLTDLAVPDSMHVSGGLGDATVLEVVMRREHKSRDEAADATRDAKKRETEARVRELEARVQTLKVQQRVAERTLQWLQRWAETVLATPQSQAKSDPAFLTAPYVANVRRFSQFYADETLKCTTRRAQLAKELDALRAEIAALRRDEACVKRAATALVPTTVGVVSLAVRAAGAVAFQLKYLVRGASWQSAYDCRVASAPGTLSLTYYGEVCNRTKEDWPRTRLFLSTASPSARGDPGTLPQATVSLRPLPPPVPPAAPAAGGLFGAPAAMMCMAAAPPPPPPCGAAPEAMMFKACVAEGACADAAPAPPPPPMQVLAATAAQALASATFEIPRRATVAADGEQHRVTVAVLADLPARLRYAAAPSASDRVFLKAVATNASAFPLLAGPGSVFVDGGFVAATQIPYTAVGAPLKLFLGTDRELRVTYVAPFRVDDTAGVLVRSKVQRFSGSVELRNGKAQPVTVAVTHPLPKADNAEIKVTLTEPKAPHEDDACAVRITAKNMVRWKARLAPGETLRLPIQYTVAYPLNKEVYFHN